MEAMIVGGTIALIILALGISATIGAIRRLGGLVNPAALFLASWAVALSLYSLRLVPYPGIGPATITLIVVSGLAFVGGVWLGGQGGWRQSAGRAGDSLRRLNELMDRRVVLTLLIGVLLLGLVATTLYTLAVARELGILAFVFSLASVRLAKPDLHYPGFLTWGAGLYIWLLAAGAGPVYRLPRWTYWLAGAALIPFTLTTGRTELFFVAITGVVAYFLRNGDSTRITARQGLAVGAVGLVLVAAFLGLSTLLMRSGRYVALDLGFPPRLISLADPYIYATGSIPALDGLVGDVTRTLDFTGPLTLWPVHRFLFALDLSPMPTNWVAEFIEIPFSFNTYTFLEPYLREYGFAGCFLASFLLGLVAAWLHRVALVGSCPPARVPYAILAFAIALSPMVNHFSQVVIPMLIVNTVFLTWSAAMVSRHVRNRGAQ